VPGTLSESLPITDAFSATVIYGGTLSEPSALSDALSVSGGTPVESAEPYPKPAGRPKPRRYVVEVDGEDFIVESVEEAQALLARAVEVAEEAAPQAVKRARRQAARKKAPETQVPVPVVQVTEGADAALQAMVAEIQARIDAAYEQAARDEELRLYLAAQAREQDDEEAVLLLL
jgi:hypothetical protein